METKILDCSCENLKIAKEFILNEELVAVPTETVYGLAGNGLSETSIKKIFIAKGRPQDNPLILHISDFEMLENIVYGLDLEKMNFLKNFWPGPLTAVFKKKEIVPDSVSCGLDTVAVRMPKNLSTQKLIKMCNVPLAAPSANLSGLPSPTIAIDVYNDLKGKIPLILDSKESFIGIESTVLDLTKKPYTILRPGFFTKKDFLKFEDDIDVDVFLKGESEIPKAPGQKYKHYSPIAKVILITCENIEDKILEIINENKEKKIGLFLFDDIKGFDCKKRISLGKNRKDLTTMANVIYKGFRDFDKDKIDIVITQGVKEEDFGFSIMNRLKKSADIIIE